MKHCFVSCCTNNPTESIFGYSQSSTELCRPSELVRVIKLMRRNKAPGLGKISNILTKNLPKKAIVYLNFIIIFCLKLSCFLRIWKEAICVSVGKFDKDPKFQFGFKKNHATTHRVFQNLKEIAKGLDVKKYV